MNQIYAEFLRTTVTILQYLFYCPTYCSLLAKKKHPDFHQMLGCQKYGGVAEIRTRASLATPNDLANRPLQPA